MENMLILVAVAVGIILYVSVRRGEDPHLKLMIGIFLIIGGLTILLANSGDDLFWGFLAGEAFIYLAIGFYIQWQDGKYLCPGEDCLVKKYPADFHVEGKEISHVEGTYHTAGRRWWERGILFLFWLPLAIFCWVVNGVEDFIRRIRRRSAKV